jgi:hypothetical protein
MIIYTLIILTFFYFLVNWLGVFSSKKLSKNVRLPIILGLIILGIIFAVGGKFFLTLPLTLISIALLKLKGLSIFQMISLFRLIQTLRSSGRFSFNQKKNNSQKISISEAYEILNLDIKKKINKDDIKRAYIKIQKKIHPDVSPETSKLSSIVNEAKDILLDEIK